MCALNLFVPAERRFQYGFLRVRDMGTGFIHNPYNGRPRAILSLFFIPLHPSPDF